MNRGCGGGARSRPHVLIFATPLYIERLRPGTIRRGGCSAMTLAAIESERSLKVQTTSLISDGDPVVGVRTRHRFGFGLSKLVSVHIYRCMFCLPQLTMITKRSTVHAAGKKVFMLLYARSPNYIKSATAYVIRRVTSKRKESQNNTVGVIQSGLLGLLDCCGVSDM